MFKKAEQMIGEICRKIRCSANVGKKAMAITLAAAVLLCGLPAVSASADAEDNCTDSGITFTIDNGNAEVLASGKGYSGALVIPATVLDSGQTYSVTEIDEYAFMGCASLTSVSIPASVTDFSIDSAPFYGCTALTDIEVDPANSVFCSIGGVLFEKDLSNQGKLYLGAYPAAKTDTQYTVPDNTDTIIPGAFMGCVNLHRMNLPDTLTKIGDRAFYGCTSLTDITLPAALTEIDDEAFYGCTNLTDITFQGSTPPDWSYYIFEQDNFPIAFHVPEGSESNYISAFADYYEPGDISVNGQSSGAVPDKTCYLGGRGGSSSSSSTASDPLKIEVQNNGDVGLFFWQRMNWDDTDEPAQYGYQNQYYDDTCCGTNLYFVKDSQQYRVQSDYCSEWFGNVMPDGCSSKVLGNGQQTASGNTITTTWQADGGNLTLKQEITYQPGQAYYQKKWTVTNSGSEGYSDIRLIHGGDTYFGGDDDSRSYWNSQTRMVYVRNQDMTHYGLLGFYGSNETPADHYFSGMYNEGDTEANSGSLSDTADGDYEDAGYQLQWDKSTLAAGASWTVTSYEQITGPGMVQVLTPSEQITAPGGTVTYEFTVQNFSQNSETYQLNAVSENGWQTSITEGSSVTVEPNGGSRVIHVNVKVPADTANSASDKITLTASSAGGSASASTKTVVDSSLPSILSVTSNSIVSAAATSMNVNVRTANVPNGTSITVSLLDADKAPLDPAVTVSGVTTGNSTAVSLPISGNLSDGTYHLAVSVDGITAVHNSTELSISSSVSTCTVLFDSNGGSPVASQTDAAVGGRIWEPKDPTQQGKTFGGWYRDKTFSKAWDFSSDVAEGDMTLYARWILNSPSSLRWEGTKAAWDSIDGASGYSVTLLKDGTPVAAESTGTGQTSYDFEEVLKKSGNGGYTFTVTAIGDGTAATDSDTSAESESYTYAGGSESSGHLISSFDPLASSIRNKTVAYGTPSTSLNLPETLSATVDNVPGILVPVLRWESSPAYDGGTPGTYIFTAVLPGGYTLFGSTAFPQVAVTVQSKSSDNHSNDTGSSSSASTTSAQTTQTQVDAASNTATVTTVPNSVMQSGDTTQIGVTVPSVAEGTGGSLDAGKAGKVEINLPESMIVQQLSSKQNVDVTLTVPSSVAQQTNSNTAVDIQVGSNVFAAAKAAGTDLVIDIKDADTQKLAYTWTFKGEDLAKSTTQVSDVNIAMAIRLTTEVQQVNQLTPDNTGLVLMFDHSGSLPSTASLTFSAKEKGFKPGQKLYFYFYNASAGQLESQAQEYTVDADGNVTVQISHCSDYVLLPNKARTITLDTRSYTMPVGNSYITGVKLTGVSGAKLKAYSSTKGIADVTVLKNGNVMATGKKAGMTYVMIDIYDNKNKFLTHASVRLIITNSGKSNGNSWRQFGIF